LHLSQPTYINKLLTRFSMQDCRPKSTPADRGTRLIHNTAPTKESSNQELFPYQEAVGSLQYCIITTRPDISCVVGQVAQFSNNPGKAQCEAVKRILAYLKGTVTHVICFKGAKINGTCFSNMLSAFSDADYAGDLTSRRSTTASCWHWIVDQSHGEVTSKPPWYCLLPRQIIWLPVLQPKI
jgi:hypothetical protein